jgi:hypothetical protein
MDCIKVYANITDADTLQKIKCFFNNCEYKYFPNNNRIIIPHENSELFSNIFSQFKDTDNLELVEIECFMLKKRTSDNFSYENQVKDGYVFDLQIVRAGKKRQLIGNSNNYQKAFVSVLLKHIIILILPTTDKFKYIFNDIEINNIIEFTQFYNFEDKLYDPYFFAFSLFVHLKKKACSIKKDLLFDFLNELQQLFDTFFTALKQHQSGLIYHEKINSHLFDGYTFIDSENILHTCLLEMIVEKINSSYGNSYFQYALPDEPVLYNIPLKDNQCIKYPSNMIHKREPYETFTDDDVIHILFKCCNHLKK